MKAEREREDLPKKGSKQGSKQDRYNTKRERKRRRKKDIEGNKERD
jgi:hypothetical protein